MKIAAYQMNVTADLDSNFSSIRNGIERAAAEGARLIAFPECAISGYPPLHYARVEDIDVEKIVDLNTGICGLAREFGIWVVVGTITTGPNGLLNSVLVISDNGDIVCRYDKIHLMPMDKHYFIAGDSVSVQQLDSVPFGVLICYDVRFPEPYRKLRELGAKFIVTIFNACGSDTWKLPVMEGAVRTRAAENSCFHIAVNVAGPLQMVTSRICNPMGLDMASANQDHEEILFAELDFRETDKGHYFDRRGDVF